MEKLSPVNNETNRKKQTSHRTHYCVCSLPGTERLLDIIADTGMAKKRIQISTTSVV